MTSTPLTARAAAGGSAQSPSITSTSPLTAARFWLRPDEKSSRTRTRCPLRTSASARWLPMKPAPPVTRMFIGLQLHHMLPAGALSQVEDEHLRVLAALQREPRRPAERDPVPFFQRDAVERGRAARHVQPGVAAGGDRDLAAFTTRHHRHPQLHVLTHLHAAVAAVARREQREALAGGAQVER